MSSNTSQASPPIALVLEDEREIRHFVRSSLEAEGWQWSRPKPSSRA